MNTVEVRTPPNTTNPNQAARDLPLAWPDGTSEDGTWPLRLDGGAHPSTDLHYGGRQRTVTPPVLMYHSVSGDRSPDPHRLRVHPKQLDRHLTLLRRTGLRGVALTQLVRAVNMGRARGLVGLTFDDGYADFLREAVPVLNRHGMTATVYVVAGGIGQSKPWGTEPRWPLMDADDLRAVAHTGHEVGSHTMMHPRLSGLAADILAVEVTQSRRVLEDVLQAEVSGFCYPYGDFDAAASEAVRKAGYDHACVTGDYEPGDRFTLPRSYISPDDTAAHLMARLVRHSVRVRPAVRSVLGRARAQPTWGRPAA